MDTIQGETFKSDTVDKAKTDREAEIAAVKSHAEELQKAVQGTTISVDMINRGSTPPKKNDEDEDDWRPSSQLKLYIIYCEPCGFKKLTDGSDVKGLIPYKQSSIPGGIPYRDPAAGEIKTPLSRPNSKKFKCPKCGRVVTVRKVADSNTQTGRSYDD